MSKQFFLTLLACSCILIACDDKKDNQQPDEQKPDITHPDEGKSCDPTSYKASCVNDNLRLICENKSITPKACGSTEICSGGNCIAKDHCDPTSYQSSCQNEHTQLVCEKNVIVSKACEDTKICSGGKCVAKDYCDPTSYQSSCQNEQTQLVCEKNVIVPKPCEDTKICSGGKCVAKDYCDPAAFTPTCKDGTHITKCDNDHIIDELCPDNQICNNNQCQPNGPATCEDTEYFNKCINNGYYLCPFGRPVFVGCNTNPCIDENGRPDCYDICDPAVDNQAISTCDGSRIDTKTCVKNSAGNFYSWSHTYQDCQYGCDTSTNDCIELELCSPYINESSCSDGKILTCEPYDLYSNIYYYKRTSCEDDKICGYNKDYMGSPSNDYAHPDCVEQCSENEVETVRYIEPNLYGATVLTCINDNGSYYWQHDFRKDISCHNGFDINTHTCIKLVPNEGEHCEESFDEQCILTDDNKHAYVYCSVVYGNTSQNSIEARLCGDENLCIDTDDYTGCIEACDPTSSETEWECMYSVEPADPHPHLSSPALTSEHHCTAYEGGNYLLPATQSCTNGCRIYSDHCYIDEWNEGSDCTPESFTNRCETDANGQEYYIYCNGRIVAKRCDCSEGTSYCNDRNSDKAMQHKSEFTAYCQHLVDSACITDFSACMNDSITKAQISYAYDEDELDDYLEYIGYKTNLPCGECTETNLGTYTDLTTCTNAYNTAEAIKQNSIYGELF